MELITIIVTFYNQRKYIESALDSCLNQTYSNIQLIVVDDCSEIDEFNIKAVSDYIVQNKKENIKTFKIIQNKNNLGTVASLNNILKNEADGVFVTFLDGDDFLVNCCLQSTYDHLFDESLDIVGGKYNSIDPKNNIIFSNQSYEEVIYRLRLSPRYLFENILKNELPFSLTGSIIRYSSLQKCNFIDSDFDLYQDRPLILNLALSGAKFGFIDEYIWTYRSHIGSSQRNSPSYIRLLKDHIRLSKKYLIPNSDKFEKNEINNLIKKQSFLLHWLETEDKANIKFIIFLLRNTDTIIKNISLSKFYSKLKRRLNENSIRLHN